MFLTLDYFTHVGIMCANVCSNLQIATTLVLTLVPFWNVLSGFYVPKPVSVVHDETIMNAFTTLQCSELILLSGCSILQLCTCIGHQAMC